MNTNIVIPLKIGVRIKPAAITLLYEGKSDVRRLRVMPVRHLSKTGPISLPLAEIKARHSRYLEKVSIPPVIFLVQRSISPPAQL